jgi:hypothetical protein
MSTETTGMADLRTLQLTIVDADGALRRVQLTDGQRGTIAALLSRMEIAVTTQQLNRTCAKQVVAKPGVPLDLVAPAVDAFLDEIASGESGPHEGVRHGVAFRFLRPGAAEGDDAGARFVYVYQTVTQIVVTQ